MKTVQSISFSLNLIGIWHERALFEERGIHIDSHIQLLRGGIHPNSCGASFGNIFYS
jgi:hypothetical protein